MIEIYDTHELVDRLNQHSPCRFILPRCRLFYYKIRLLFLLRCKERTIFIRKLFQEYKDDERVFALYLILRIKDYPQFNPFYSKSKSLLRNKEDLLYMFNKYKKFLCKRNRRKKLPVTKKALSRYLKDDVKFFFDKIQDNEKVLLNRLVKRFSDCLLKNVQGNVTNIHLYFKDFQSIFSDNFLEDEGLSYCLSNAVSNMSSFLKDSKYLLHHNWQRYSFWNFLKYVNRSTIETYIDDETKKFMYRIKHGRLTLFYLKYIRATVDGKETIFLPLSDMNEIYLLERVDDMHPHTKIACNMNKSLFEYSEFLEFIKENNVDDRIYNYLSSNHYYAVSTMPITYLNAFNAVVNQFILNFKPYKLDIDFDPKQFGFKTCDILIQPQNIDYGAYTNFDKKGYIDASISNIFYTVEECAIEENGKFVMSCGVSGEAFAHIKLYKNPIISDEQCIVRIFDVGNTRLIDKGIFNISPNAKVSPVAQRRLQKLLKAFIARIVRYRRINLLDSKPILDHFFNVLCQYLIMYSEEGRKIFFDGNFDKFSAEMSYSYNINFNNLQEVVILNEIL